MPRDIKKLKELERIISEKDLELAKYKQLISGIQALIIINGIKLHEDDYADLLAGEYQRQKQKPINNDEIPSKAEIREKVAKSEKKEPEPKKCISCQEASYLDSNFCDKCFNRTKELPQETPKTHVDELTEELGRQAETGEEYPKPSKIKKRTRRSRDEVLTDAHEKATEATATQQQQENQKLSMEERIAKLPTEAQILIRTNQARAKAAEKEKHYGQEGDREYARLLKKEQQATGEIPADGNCPHCSEQLEAPITRGYHQECWEAKQQREQVK